MGQGATDTSDRARASSERESTSEAPQRSEERDGARTALNGAFLYSVVFGIDSLAAFGLVSVITRALTITEFAHYTFLKLGLSIALLLANVNGIAAMRMLSAAPAAKERRVIISTLLWTQLVPSLVIAGVACGIAPFIPGHWVAPITATSAAFVTLLTTHGIIDVLRGLGQHGMVTLLISIEMVVFIAMTLLSLYLDAGVTGLLAARAISSFVALPIGIYAIRDSLTTRPDMAMARTMFRFGKNTALYQTLRALGNADRYLLGVFGALTAASVMQVATVPVAGIEMMEISLVMALEPYLYGLAANRRGAEIRRAFVIMAAAMLAASAALSLAGPELMPILAPEEYADTVLLLSWVVAAAAVRALTRLIVTAAGFTGDSRVWAIAAGVELVVSLGLLIPAVGQWGLVGAGAAKLIGALSGLYACYYLSRATWSFELPIHAVGLACIGCCVGGTLLASHAVFEPMHLAQRAAIVVAVLVILGIVVWKHLREVLSAGRGSAAVQTHDAA